MGRIQRVRHGKKSGTLYGRKFAKRRGGKWILKKGKKGNGKILVMGVPRKLEGGEEGLNGRLGAPGGERVVRSSESKINRGIICWQTAGISERRKISVSEATRKEERESINHKQRGGKRRRQPQIPSSEEKSKEKKGGENGKKETCH